MTEKLIELQKNLYSGEQQRRKHANGTIFSFDDIIGESDSIKQTVTIAKKFARSLSPVIIQGETGTGKELFAQSIHNYSSRANGPFVAVNCAAIPESLLEGILSAPVKVLLPEQKTSAVFLKRLLREPCFWMKSTP